MQEQPKKKVMIAIPTKTAGIHARLVENLIPQLPGNLFITVVGISPVAFARNQIVEAFLASDATHLWMIDDDTIVPHDAIWKLLGVEQDIVTGVTPIIREGSITSNVWMTDESEAPLTLGEIEKHKEPFKVRGVGASCLLLSRNFVERLTKPYFAEIWEAETGRFITEDIFLCNTAIEMGYEIYAHPDVLCKHARQVVI